MFSAAVLSLGTGDRPSTTHRRKSARRRLQSHHHRLIQIWMARERKHWRRDRSLLVSLVLRWVGRRIMAGLRRGGDRSAAGGSGVHVAARHRMEATPPDRYARTAGCGRLSAGEARSGRSARRGRRSAWARRQRPLDAAGVPMAAPIAGGTTVPDTRNGHLAPSRVVEVRVRLGAAISGASPGARVAARIGGPSGGWDRPAPQPDPAEGPLLIGSLATASKPDGSRAQPPHRARPPLRRASKAP